MKKIICFVLSMLSILFINAGCNANSVYGSTSGQLIYINSDSDFTDVAMAVSPAVVGINGETDTASSVGSGVCVSANGYILTNSHVIHGCKHIDLYLHDKSNASAKIIYDDPIMDLAIIRANVNMPYLKLGNSDDLVVGQDVLAVGTPMSLTLSHTFTKGIVSSLNRTLKVGGTNGEGYMQNLIQHDASLNPGNSGGPLLNIQGEVVGINTLKISGGEGIGFAIPTKSFASLLANYISTDDYVKPYMGLYGFDTEIANFNGLTTHNIGFYVLDVSDESPLKNSGIENGAVIIELNGIKIKNTLDLKNELYKYDANDMVKISYYLGENMFSVYTYLKKQL